MARDIVVLGEDNPANSPLYFVAYSVTSGLYVNGTSLESYNGSHWTSYAIALSLDSQSGNYYGDFPDVPYGPYVVTIYIQAGSSPATTDEVFSAGDYQHPDDDTPSETFTDQYQVDSAIFINGSEFAEPVVYKQRDNSNNVIATLNIYAVINRHLPEVITDDGKVIADYIELSVRNDAIYGLVQVNPKRDTVTCSGRFGGSAKEHLVTAVANSDAGIYQLRAR
jgi:hypothetical protein